MKALAGWRGEGHFMGRLRFMCRPALADHLRALLGRHGQHARGVRMDDLGPRWEPPAEAPASTPASCLDRVQHLPLAPGQFRVLVTILEHGNQVRAARALGISKSAVAHTVKRIREIAQEVGRG